MCSCARAPAPPPALATLPATFPAQRGERTGEKAEMTGGNLGGAVGFSEARLCPLGKIDKTTHIPPKTSSVLPRRSQTNPRASRRLPLSTQIPGCPVKRAEKGTAGDTERQQRRLSLENSRTSPKPPLPHDLSPKYASPRHYHPSVIFPKEEKLIGPEMFRSVYVCFFV